MEEIPEYFKLSSGNCVELIRKNHKIPEFSVANNPNETRIRYFRNLLCDKMALYIRDFKKKSNIEAHNCPIRLRCHYLQCRFSGLLHS